MNTRICPKCSSKLSEFDNYFCSTCGEKLAEDVISVPPEIKLVKHALNSVGFVENLKTKIPKKKKTEKFEQLREVSTSVSPVLKKKNPMLFVLIGVIFMGILGFFGIDILADLASKTPLPKEEKLPSSFNVIKYDLKMESSLFGSDVITDYVPSEVDAYFESNDLQRFLQRFVKDKNFNSSLIEQSDKLVNNHFAVFTNRVGEEQAWTFIIIPKDLALVELVIKDTKLPNWNMGIVEDRLVITTHPEVFEQVRNAKKKVVMNLSLNPKYSKVKGNVPTTGQVLAVFFDETGTAALQSAKEEDITEYLIEVIDVILDSGFNEVVLQGE